MLIPLKERERDLRTKSEVAPRRLVRVWARSYSISGWNPLVGCGVSLQVRVAPRRITGAVWCQLEPVAIALVHLDEASSSLHPTTINHEKAHLIFLVVQTY